MPDSEKVIKGLEQFRNDLKPFCGNHADWERFDAGLSLLRGQEAVKPVCKIFFDIPYYFCGQCNEMLNMYSTKAMFCSKCGHPVKWGAVKE